MWFSSIKRRGMWLTDLNSPPKPISHNAAVYGAMRIFFRLAESARATPSVAGVRRAAGGRSSRGPAGGRAANGAPAARRLGVGRRATGAPAAEALPDRTAPLRRRHSHSRARRVAPR